MLLHINGELTMRDIQVRLRIKPHYKIDDVIYRIVNSPFICNNIPTLPTYGVYISQLINIEDGWTIQYIEDGQTMQYIEDGQTTQSIVDGQTIHYIEDGWTIQLPNETRK
jgi:hypothetical protein